jgi:hypothetical protein
MKLCATTLASFILAWVATTNCLNAEQLDQYLDLPIDPSQARVFTSRLPKLVAQTFTVGLPGYLSRVDVALFRSSNFSVPFELRISHVNSGNPEFLDPNPLAIKQISTADIPIWSPGAPISSQFLQIDYSNDHIQVSPGDNLAIVLTWGFLGLEQIGWWTNTNSQPSYTAGSFFQFDVVLQTPFDLGLHSDSAVQFDGQFRTYVTSIPEPGAFVLLAYGSLHLALLRRRRSFV